MDPAPANQIEYESKKQKRAQINLSKVPYSIVTKQHITIRLKKEKCEFHHN